MHARNFSCPLFSNGRDGSRQWKTDVHKCRHQGDFVSQRYIYLLCSDLASAEKSVKKQTQFFSYCKTCTRSSKFFFYGFHCSDILIEVNYLSNADPFIIYIYVGQSYKGSTITALELYLTRKLHDSILENYKCKLCIRLDNGLFYGKSNHFTT